MTSVTALYVFNDLQLSRFFHKNTGHTNFCYFYGIEYFFREIPHIFCGISFAHDTQSKCVFEEQFQSYNFTRKCEIYRKRFGISQKIIKSIRLSKFA